MDHDTPNLKAPGLNGILTDLYKKLHQCYVKNQKTNKPGFNIIAALREAFNHIKTSGTCETEFLEGWLCPIYKKKDHHEPANCYLITILNTEYKILTTAIMGELSTVAPKLIHKCQATFIKKCSIHNQIDLVTQMTELCEITRQNGAIITLDQEKAYDKIQHDYLWRVL